MVVAYLTIALIAIESERTSANTKETLLQNNDGLRSSRRAVVSLQKSHVRVPLVVDVFSQFVLSLLRAEPDNFFEHAIDPGGNFSVSANHRRVTTFCVDRVRHLETSAPSVFNR